MRLVSGWKLAAAGVCAMFCLAQAMPARGGLMFGTWQTAAPIPTATAQAVAVTDPLSGDIYFAGGYTAVNPGETNAFFVYHPATNSWNSRMPLINPTRGAAGAYSNGKIYIFGGTSSSAAFHTVQVYTIATNSWASLALPLSSWEASAVAMPDGTIIVTGGEGTAGRNFRYDPVANSTTLLASLPSPSERNGGETALIAGKIVIAGGFTSGGLALANVDSYDPVANTWSVAPADLPSARDRTAAGSFANHMLVAGGSDQYVNAAAPYFTAFNAYDPVANSWQVGPSLPQGTREAAGAVSGDKFYVFGGFSAGGYSSTVYSISVPEPSATVALALMMLVTARSGRRA